MLLTTTHRRSPTTEAMLSTLLLKLIALMAAISLCSLIILSLRSEISRGQSRIRILFGEIVNIYTYSRRIYREFLSLEFGLFPHSFFIQIHKSINYVSVKWEVWGVIGNNNMVHKVFVWPYGGRDIFLCSSFSGWTDRTRMTLVEGSSKIFQVICNLPPGCHQVI